MRLDSWHAQHSVRYWVFLSCGKTSCHSEGLILTKWQRSYKPWCWWRMLPLWSRWSRLESGLYHLFLIWNQASPLASRSLSSSHGWGRLNELLDVLKHNEHMVDRSCHDVILMTCIKAFLSVKSSSFSIHFWQKTVSVPHSNRKVWLWALKTMTVTMEVFLTKGKSREQISKLRRNLYLKCL